MKTIGISGNIQVDDLANQAGHKKAYISMDYIDATIKTGVAPVILPVTTDESVIAHYIASIDGLILSGGQDVSPHLFNEDPKIKLQRVLPERDACEYLLIKHAIKRGIPILGICRGLQILNVYFGGSLHQDVSYGNLWMQHNQEELPQYAAHAINVVPGTILHGIFKQEKIYVNSFHHQVINELADGFSISASAADGAIEAIESTDSKQFILAVQWHPEMLAPADTTMLDIFSAFYAAIVS